MSAQAGHNVRILIAMLAPLRERLRDRLVDHGGKGEGAVERERETAADMKSPFNLPAS